MRWIVDASVRFRRLILAAAAGVMIVGIAQIGSTPVDGLPEFSPPTVEVQTEALGLSAEEVEQLITVPLEQDLLVGVPFLDEIESVSMPGLSSVVMTFERGTDLLDARQLVQERLTQAVGIAGLPAVAKLPQMIQPLSSKSRVAMVKLSSDQLTPIEVSVLARWVIGPRLMSVPGVANVVVWGNRERQLQVQVDPQRLRKNNTTLSQVISTAGNALEVSPLSFLQASSPGTGGFIDTANQRLNIFHEQAIATPAQLAQVPLENAGGGVAADGARSLALGDVTDVVENHQPLIGDAVCAGGEDCLLLVVEKFPGSNTIEVTQGVEEALSALRPGLSDMQMDSSIYRPASYVESSFANLGWALLAGAVLLLLTLGLFFWNWRTSLLSVVAVGVSIATALVVLQLRGTTINLMVVAGLMVALTAVIYDAVNDVEGIDSRLRQRDPAHPRRAPVWRTVVDASAEMRRSMFCAVLVVAAAALPIFFMRGEGGAFLPPIALSYLLAVAASMLVALTVTPALAVALMSKNGMHRTDPPAVSRLHRGYNRVAPRFVARPGIAVGVAAGIAAIGLVATPFLDTSLRPSLQERDVLVRVEAGPGTSLPTMTEITGGMVQRLGSLPGVANVGSHVGRAVMADEIVNVNSGEIWVNLDPEADYDATVASIESTVADQRGLSTDVMTYSEQQVTDVLERSSDDIVIRVYGEDASVLDSKATELRAMLAGMDGVTEAVVDRVPEEATVEVQVDLQQAQAAGIKPGDVRRTAASLLGGITVGNLFDEQKVFDVVVWGAPSIRQSEADIEQLLIDTPGGGHVRLADVSDVRVVPNPTEIRHESVASYLDVTANVSDGNIGAVADAVDERLDQLEFPLEHHAEILGGYEEQQANQGRLLLAAAGAAIAIFLLLQAALGSWRLALLALVSMPLALAGGVVAALFVGGVTLGSLAGLLAVLGLAARGVVVLIRRFQRLERSDGATFGAEVVLTGTRESLAPTLVSTLATALVLAPIAVVGGVTGFEMLHPMAIVVLGGLVTVAVVTLFVVPVLYLRYGYVPNPDTWADHLYSEAPEPSTPERGVTGNVMQRLRRVLPVVPFVVVPGLLLSSCAGSVVADSYVIEHEPAKTVAIPGSDSVRVVMEEPAAERLRLETSTVQATRSGLVVPSAAVFVDTEGVWWVYTNPEPLVFVRSKIGLTKEADGKAFLSSGPPAGARVVTVGVAELSGVEAEVGH